MHFEKITLEGKYTKLVPLTQDHQSALVEAIKDGELWKLFFTFVPHPNEINAYIKKANLLFKSGEALQFVIIDKATNKVAGSTAFLKASFHNKRLEIGSTFLGKSFQETALNTESKLLMLTHAFEVLKLNRVEFLTDYLNVKSRNSILRIGAKEEGIIRNHRVMPDGRVRDTIVFSIIVNEWDGIKQNLLYKLS